MQFLLERLSLRPRGPDGREEPFDPVAAAMAQIQRIVATGRQSGGGIGAVPWGMPSTTTISAGSTRELSAYADVLRERIQRHEPRLSEVKVEVERSGDPLSPYVLVVSAVFPNEDEPRDLRIPAPF